MILPTLTKKWFGIAVALAALGVCLSIYYIYHYQNTRFGFNPQASFCSLNAYVDCDSLQFTEDAHWFGIPMGAFALLFFLVYIQLVTWMRGGITQISLMALRGWALGGLAVVIQKIYVGMAVYQKLCLTCMGGWVLIAILFLMAWVGLRKRQDPSAGASSPIPSVTLLTDLAKQGGVFLLIGLVSLVAVPRGMLGNQEQQILAQSEQVLKTKFKDGPVTLPDSLLLTQLPEGDYHWGSTGAPVRVVVFHDFECPFCRQMTQVFEQLKVRFSKQMLFVLKNFPMDPRCNPSVAYPAHPFACRFAQVARCIGRTGQEQFWKAYRLINQKDLKDTELSDITNDLAGVSEAEVSQCVDAQQELVRIQTDALQGKMLNISGTPTFFINGYRFEGYVPFGVLEKFIIRLLDRSS
jgi:protein-disulfide isomerase/uncharacterized membrane protein